MARMGISRMIVPREAAVAVPAGSAGRKGISPGSVRREVGEVTGSAGTAGRRGTWPMTARSPRCAAGAGRRGTRRTSAQSPPGASTAAR